MGYQGSVEGYLDYSICHYGQSRLDFRGPKKALEDGFVAFLGGTETFGKFVAAPFPELVGEVIGRQTVNLGCVNAGIDTFLADTTVREVCEGASACVIQVMGAHMLSNPHYRVHARRNDRFLAAKPDLRSLFPNADLTDVHFARHLIATLAEASAEGLATLRRELSALWVWRMQQLLDLLHVPVVLVWVSARSPDEAGDAPDADDPLFVDRDMLEALGPRVAGIVEVTRNSAARTSNSLPLTDLAAARELPGQITHFQVAAGVSDVLKGVL